MWAPDAEQRDLRQLLIHRHKLVEIRTRVKNGLQHLAMNRGMQKKSRLWSGGRAEGVGRASAGRLGGVAARRSAAVAGECWIARLASWTRLCRTRGRRQRQARLLMTQPGVGPITSLAFVLTIGDVARFKRGKQVASYLGLIPREHSSGGKQRLGAISKQGNRFVRMLLVEAAQTATRLDEGFRKQYQHRCHRMPKGVAKVAAARRLAVRLYWMLRTQHGVSGDRSHREQPERGPGRRKLDRKTDWALSHPDWPVQKTAQSTRLGKR